METGKQRPSRTPEKRSKTYREICPVEIKSAGYNSQKSLDRFHEKYSGRILQRYLVYAKELKKDKGILCIPAYMSAMI